MYNLMHPFSELNASRVVVVHASLSAVSDCAMVRIVSATNVEA